MPALLACAALGFAGFSLLLPVAPMWAVHIGADSLGAGAVNSRVLMLFTVIAQLLVGRLLRRAGWGVTQALGLVLLGIPAVLHALTGSPWQVLLLAALRGLGFGILTVCSVRGHRRVDPAGAPRPGDRRLRSVHCGTAVRVDPAGTVAGRERRVSAGVRAGRDSSAGGAAGVRPPGADPGGRTAFEPTRQLRAAGQPDRRTRGDQQRRAGRSSRSHRYWVVRQPRSARCWPATGMAALARWLVGGVADRHGPAGFIAPMLGVGAVGLAVIAVGIGVGGGLVILGCALLGTAYGGLQNLTLVQAFAATGEHARGAVSVAWNVGFDAGTGLGSLAVGALATSFSFPTAFAVMTAACVGVGLMWVLTRHDGQSGRGTAA